MKCTHRETSEGHHTGRTVLRCERCNGHGLMPPSGLPEHLVVECMAWPHWHEFGHWLEIALQVIGITKARWSWCTRKKGGCGCNQRQELANTLGHKLALFLSGLGGRLRGYLSPVNWNLSRHLKADFDAASRQNGQDRDLDATVNDD